MLRHYFKTTLRSMRRHKAYASINILGLAVGLAASFLILLWVNDELAFDRFDGDDGQIYRVMRTARHGEGQVYTSPSVTAKLDEVLDEDYPEITNAALFSWQQKLVFSRGDRTFRESGNHAGRDYFQIFAFPFLAGDRGSALQNPDAVVLTLSMARKFFPEGFSDDVSYAASAASILGQTIRLEDRLDVTVTAVMEDLPAQSSVQYNFLLPAGEYTQRNSWTDQWSNNGMRLYVKLQAGTNAELVSAKIANVIKEHEEDSVSELFLQPYRDIYLRSDFENGVLVGGRIEYVQILALVGIFILLLASINFMNLTTARSTQRALEIGIRKSFGSSQRSLAGLFLGEAILTALVALGFAAVAVWLLLPSFNALAGKQMTLADPASWAQFAALTVLTGLVAGAYPAIYLSRVRITRVLRSGDLHASAGSGLRKSLVVFQFAVSIALIVCTFTVYSQLDYIRTKNLGVDKENVVFSELVGGASEQFETFRSELLQYPSITSVTSGSENPLEVNTSTDGVEWDGKSADDRTLFSLIRASIDYVETMRMEVLDGRSFSPAFVTDTNNVVINEAAARAIGLDNPVGQRLAVWGRDGQIVGVVKDFHMASMYDAIQPLIFRLEPEDNGILFLRTAAGQTEDALAAFEEVFTKFSPAFPFEYQFLDDNYESTYRSEFVIGTLASYFAGLALFVACLGLFGLAAFTAERRTKEIGIRKVLGASATQVALLLSKDFAKLVIIAFVVSAPVAYYLMTDWLNGFTFHTQLGVGMFVVAAVSVFVVAYATVGYQSFRAALANPVDSLRSE